MDAVLMVRTSLKMPQIDSVTTEVRCRRANSLAVIQNAKQPGNRRMRSAKKVPFSAAKTPKAWKRSKTPSTGKARMNRVPNMMGARKKTVENGLEVAGWRMRRI